MIKETSKKGNKTISTYTAKNNKKELDEIIKDLMSSYQSNKKMTITVHE
jgi:hypothetical protein